MISSEERALSSILRSKYWPCAERMINALNATREPLTSKALRSISGCSTYRTHGIIALVRRYYEKVEHKTVNRMADGTGFYVGDSVGDHLDQASDQIEAGLSRLARHNQTMEIVGKPDLDKMNVDDREALAAHNAFSHGIRMLEAIAADNEKILMRSTKNKERLRDAAKKAKSPIDPMETDSAIVVHRAPKSSTKDPK